MLLNKRARLAVAQVCFIFVLLTGCNAVAPKISAAPLMPTAPQMPAADVKPVETARGAGSQPVQLTSTAGVKMPTITPTVKMATAAIAATAGPSAAATAGEPAGCLTEQAQSALSDPQKMLAYADRLLSLDRPLATRRLVGAWNAYAGKNLPDTGSIVLAVEDVENKYLVQRMMNALQVSGFVTWLRKSPDSGLQILALSLNGAPAADSAWQPYIQAYWQSRESLPSDAWVLPALKLPPCGWETARGLAPQVSGSWWAPAPAAWPDYTVAAAAYLADSSQAANQVAHRMHWLEASAVESPDAMCGPLVWSEMHDAGALPPDWGGWSMGGRAFWLAKPRTNGRPWSLFPQGMGHVYAFRQPLGSFDFSNFTLYPGDFFYSYSAGDGFDHMFLVTEVDADGSVYTITNLIQTKPVYQATIQRVLLLNLHDPTVGIARNQWAKDRVHGRTGHAGFDVFRWAWMEKDITGRSALYTVQPGDTLGLVAERWKTPMDQIARYNGIGVDAVLSLGQQMYIPPLEKQGR